MNLPQKQVLGGNRMLRKLTIALLVLTVAALPLTATCVLAADGAQQTTHTGGRLALPFAGCFSAKYVPSGLGVTTYSGNGLFTSCGWSKVDVRQVVIPKPPYQMTIKTVKGDINLLVAFGSNTYHVTGGTGCFAGASGMGYFSLHKSTHGSVTGCLDGTIVLAL
jgi:hypothetical protein